MSEDCCLNGAAFLLNAFMVSMLHISIGLPRVPHETANALNWRTRTRERIFGAFSGKVWKLPFIYSLGHTSTSRTA